jgi:hypothetical protein
MEHTRQEFDANVHRIRQMWHEFDNALKDFERRAAPVCCPEMKAEREEGQQ